MQVEFNEAFKKADDTFKVSDSMVAITPPVGEDYWVFRVKLYMNQAIIAFPKFFTLGVGFAVENDWNTNLPYSTNAEELYAHIEHNKKYKKITKEQCIEAINLLKPHCERFLKGDKN